MRIRDNKHVLERVGATGLQIMESMSRIYAFPWVGCGVHAASNPLATASLAVSFLPFFLDTGIANILERNRNDDNDAEWISVDYISYSD